MEVLVIEKEAFQEDLAVLLTLNISSTCWRELVACAPYGRALSSLLYKHEQNARGATRTGNYSYHQKKNVGATRTPLTIIFKPQKEKNCQGRLAPEP